mgnify:CR=1 FL=1
MLGPVVASEGFVGVVLEAATTGVELGLVGAPVLVVVAAVAGADEVAVVSGVAVSGAADGTSLAGGVDSAAGVVGVFEGAGAGAETEMSVGGMLLVDGAVLPVTVGVSGVLLGLYAAKF